MKYDNPYAKGHETERFSPITGNRYPVGKNHESADLDDDENLDNNYLKPYQKDYKGNRRNDRGENFKRSPSPYEKIDKGKGKQNPNPNYKGRHYDENYQKNKKASDDQNQATQKE